MTEPLTTTDAMRMLRKMARICHSQLKTELAQFYEEVADLIEGLKNELTELKGKP